MKLQFYLRFHTQAGQSLWISGNSEELGNEAPESAVPMEFLNEEFWTATVDIKKKSLTKPIYYKYYLRNEDGEWIQEWGNDRSVELPFNKPLNQLL